MILYRFNSYCLIKLLYSTLHDQSCGTLGRNQPTGLMADINLSRRRDIRAIDIFVYLFTSAASIHATTIESSL